MNSNSTLPNCVISPKIITLSLTIDPQRFLIRIVFAAPHGVLRTKDFYFLHHFDDYFLNKYFSLFLMIQTCDSIKIMYDISFMLGCVFVKGVFV